MTSHLSNLLESFSRRNHTCILGTPDFTDSSSEHFLEKTNKQNKILQFFTWDKCMFTKSSSLFTCSYLCKTTLLCGVVGNLRKWGQFKNVTLPRNQYWIAYGAPLISLLIVPIQQRKILILVTLELLFCLIIRNTAVITCW